MTEYYIPTHLLAKYLTHIPIDKNTASSLEFGKLIEKTYAYYQSKNCYGEYLFYLSLLETKGYSTKYTIIQNLLEDNDITGEPAELKVRRYDQYYITAKPDIINEDKIFEIKLGNKVKDYAIMQCKIFSYVFMHDIHLVLLDVENKQVNIQVIKYDENIRLPNFNDLIYRVDFYDKNGNIILGAYK
ncbi:MAG: hypothetical protein QXO37_06840 [Candidatus Nitrosocaldaceae archaeon]